MGKFLGSILTTIVGVALLFVPGAQTIGISLIASGIGQFLTTLLTPGAPKPDTVESAIKTSRPPRVSAYGRSRLYGAYVLYETAGNGSAVDVYAVADGKADAIETRYLNDEVVTVSGGGIVNQGADGRYANNSVGFYTTDGSTPGAGFPAVAALLGAGVWTNQHRGDGVVAMALTAASVKAEDFQKIYPSSTVPTPSIVGRWQRCPDPAAANPLDENGWTWTENPVRQLLHYKLVREGPRPTMSEDDPAYAGALYGLRLEWWNRKIAPTLAYWIAAAAVCDEPVPLKAGGTEARYRSLVSHRHVDKHEGVIANFMATFDGWICPRSDGALIVYAGRYYVPDPVNDLIGPDEIVSYSWNGGAVDDDTAINEIICNYTSAEHDYNTVECDAWRDEVDIAERGQILSETQEIFVPSHGQARRLAKRKMQKLLAVDRGKITTNLAGRHARGKRFVYLKIEEAGTTFYEGPAEITSLSRAVQGGVTFDWVAADPNVDNWNAGTEEGEPAAIGNRIAPEPLDAPVINSVTVGTVGGSYFLDIDATGPDRADLTWYAHWRIQTASVWGPDLEYSDTDTGTPVALSVGPVPADETLEVQISYQIGDGRFSDWSDAASAATGEIIYDGGTP